MTGICLRLSLDEDWALKAWSLKHGYTSKSAAAVYMIEYWLKEKGYLEETVEEALFNEGYENT